MTDRRTQHKDSYVMYIIRRPESIRSRQLARWRKLLATLPSLLATHKKGHTGSGLFCKPRPTGSRRGLQNRSLSARRVNSGAIAWQINEGKRDKNPQKYFSPQHDQSSTSSVLTALSLPDTGRSAQHHVLTK